MQPSDKNMDELFRRAAAEYPLKTDNGNWDAVAGRLAGEEGAPSEKIIGGKDYRKLLWLLLLLPLGAVGYNIYFKAGTSKNIVQHKAEHVFTNNDQHKSLNRSKENKTAANASLPEIGLQHITADNDKVNNNSAGKFPSGKILNHVNNIDKSHSSLNNKFSSNSLNNSVHASNNVTLGSITNALNQASSTKEISPQNNSAHAENNITANAASPVLNNDPADLKKEITAATKDSSAEHEHKKPVIKKYKQYYFYAGILAGADASTIKFQSVKNAGYSLGVLAGYKFSSHFSAEAGFNWDKKRYYTDGKYFDVTKAGFPAGDKIVNMNGNCSMFEIPVVLKYDFAQKIKNNFFATAGFSSYLMKKEGYQYTADYYGNLYTANKSYTNSSRNWFSVAQLSIGYERHLDKNYTLRIEPYAKIPLGGLGIGSMPITSAGLYIGITKSIH